MTGILKTEIKRVSNNQTKNDWLLEHRKNVTSQTGKDGIIEKVFEIIGAQSKWCVEFGAYDGKFCSNTYNIINRVGIQDLGINEYRTSYVEHLPDEA